MRKEMLKGYLEFRENIVSTCIFINKTRGERKTSAMPLPVKNTAPVLLWDCYNLLANCISLADDLADIHSKLFQSLR
jgi:hypothetical protein